MAFGVSGALASNMVSRRQVERLVRHARAQDVSIFDTAPSYGSGEAERRLGAALAGDHDVVLMTKAGVSSSGLSARSRDFSPDGVLASVEASLERLQRERIDLLWLHGPSVAELSDVLFERLERIIDSGKVGYVGLTLTGRQISAARKHQIVSALMTPVNPDMNDDGVARIASVRAAGKAVFAIKAFAGMKAVRRFGTTGAIWRLAKVLSGDRLHPHVSHSAEDVVEFVFDKVECDVMVSTTTSLEHLEQNSAMMRSVELR